jgi:hypothetical protein
MVQRAGSVFNENGDLIDEAVARRLAAFVASFAGHCRAVQS